ncbi:MAG: CHAT domain-containing protein, partial [Phaeodactylibacter sp.]|nr:CHAT domain-containing protein [Phaeodactylibacter sp.]
YFSKGLRNSYNMLGILHTILGDNRKAVRLYQTAIAQARPLGDSVLLNAYYDNLGKAWLSLSEWQNAQQAFEAAKALGKAAPGHYELRLAETFLVGAQWQKAIDQAQAAERKMLEQEDRDIPLTSIYLALGEASNELGRLPAAATYFEKALSWARQEYPEGHREIGKALVWHGELLAKTSRPQAGLKALQEALELFIPAFQPRSLRELPPAALLTRETWLMATLKLKGEIFEQRYRETGKLADLACAGRHYQLAVAHINRAKQLYSDDAAKSFWGAYSTPFIEAAVRSQLRLFERDQNAAHLDTAFLLAQSANAYLLRERIQEDRLLPVAGISADSIRLLEDQRDSLLAVEEALQESRHQAERDNLLLDWVRQSRELELLQAALKTSYPEYARLSSAVPQISLENLQEQVDEETLFINYFVGQDSIYAFAGKGTNIQVYSAALDTLFTGHLTRYRRSISDLDYIRTARTQAENEFLESSFWLYQQLVAPALNLDTSGLRKLLLIPDGPLGYLVFDCLLTAPAASWLDSDHFLLKKYALQYQYAAGLITQESTQAAGRGFLGFGIEYGEDLWKQFQLPEKDTIRNDSILPFLRGKNWGPLKFADDEVRAVGKSIKGRYFLNEKAQKSRFVQYCSDYDIIHIAAHGFVEAAAGPEAYLLFHPGRATDYLLGLQEVIRLDIPAQLVVLSACQTATGALLEGEGVMSIARGFQVAGCRSVLASQWSLTDQTTYQLMQRFYAELKKGHSKSEALRAAKLQYLQDDALSSPAYRLPVYWAALTLVGDDSALLLP